VIAGFESRRSVSIAAMPMQANAAVPASIAATLRSSAMRVGFCVRPYSKPACGWPRPSCTYVDV
jgi:hypothetical protein